MLADTDSRVLRAYLLTQRDNGGQLLVHEVDHAKHDIEQIA